LKKKIQKSNDQWWNQIYNPIRNNQCKYKKLQIIEEGLNPKKKNKLIGWYDFSHGQHMILGRKKGKEKKKKKTNSGQTLLNHQICAQSKEEKDAETNNDVAEALLQSPELVARATQSWRSIDTLTFLFFLYKTKNASKTNQQ